MESLFTIDFFEFSCLVEACIPPRPIARSMFFESVSNRYYHQMTPIERAHLLEWISRSPQFDLEKEECIHFKCRFDTNNQFRVYAERDGEPEMYDTYLYCGRYHTQKNKSIVPEYITRVEPIAFDLT